MLVFLVAAVEREAKIDRNVGCIGLAGIGVRFVYGIKFFVIEARMGCFQAFAAYLFSGYGRGPHCVEGWPAVAILLPGDRNGLQGFAKLGEMAAIADVAVGVEQLREDAIL